MNFGVKLRLIALALGVGLMGGLIVFVTWTSQRQAGELRARLSVVDVESFQIADQFRDSLRRLNNTLFRYGIQHQASDLDQFHQASHELDLWIDEQKPRLRTPREKEIMQQMDAAYDGYLSAARELQAKVQALGGQSASMAEFAGLLAESQRRTPPCWR